MTQREDINTGRPMVVLICGSRDWTDWEAVRDAVDNLPEGAIVIEGEARGVDKMARIAAHNRGLFVAEVPCEDSHWRKFKRRAGHERNSAMLALRPDHVIAFQLNGSNGTQGTIDKARAAGLCVEVHSR